MPKMNTNSSAKYAKQRRYRRHDPASPTSDTGEDPTPRGRGQAFGGPWRRAWRRSLSAATSRKLWRRGREEGEDVEGRGLYTEHGSIGSGQAVEYVGEFTVCGTVFTVPEGFSLPKAVGWNHLVNTSVDLDSLGDAELDAQLIPFEK
nr:protein MIS12 homolog [Ipomoea batatas]